jgi:ribosomal-protein-alanine N-acetyltransferase
MTGAALRRATAVDAELLAALHAPCFPDEPWDGAGFARLLAIPGASCLLLEAEGAPRGLVLLRRAADEVEVVTLAVEASARRMGYGGRLLRAALAEAAAEGARRAYLEVAEDNAAARGLYAGLGFAVCGRRPAYYRRAGGPARDAVVLAAPLPLAGD